MVTLHVPGENNGRQLYTGFRAAVFSFLGWSNCLAVQIAVLPDPTTCSCDFVGSQCLSVTGLGVVYIHGKHL